MKTLKLEELTLEQKLGMVYCGRPFEPEDLEFVLELIEKRALGCVQVPLKRPDIMEKIRRAADYPIILIADMEMGYPGSQLPPIPMMTLAACGKPEYYRAFARALVTDAKNAGYNGTWGPVIDVPENGSHRTFSNDPQKVALAAEEICRVFADNHFLSCGKHYPGGHKIGDTHMANLGSEDSLETLLNKRLMPYQHLMAKGLLPSIMAGHTTHLAVDPEYPASLSKKTIDLIRNMGYDGLCFTDDLAMMAIQQKFDGDKVMGMAMAAGNDILLPDYRRPARQTFALLQQNYRDGAFTEERLNEAVRRVLAAQEYIGSQPEKPDLFTQEDLETYTNIAKDCITAVTDPGVDAALDMQNKDRLFVVIVENENVARELTNEFIVRNWYHPEAVIEKLQQEFPEAEIITLPAYASATENKKVLIAATAHKEVVFVTFCNTRPYLGTNCLTRRTEAVINALNYSGKVSAVLHFGTPFALQPLNHIKRKLFGYMMPQSQLYAIEVLAGKLPAKGKLPFHVEFQ